MDTQESLIRKINGAKDIKSVVRTMKAMAAANICQYELAVGSLGAYYRTVALGIIAYFKSETTGMTEVKIVGKKDVPNRLCALVFGSDQGLVGSFNNTLTDFVAQTLRGLPGEKEVWTVGERVELLLQDSSFPATTHFLVPNSIQAITPLVGQILIQAQQNLEKGELSEFYIFHNQPNAGTGYQAVYQRLLPLDTTWRATLGTFSWPTKAIPQVAGGRKPTLPALIREFLFVSLFKACAESLASENASRLESMQRAEKNINELLDDLSHKYHRERQSAIDEELFDVVSGVEALKTDNAKGPVLPSFTTELSSTIPLTVLDGSHKSQSKQFRNFNAATESGCLPAVRQCLRSGA
ncbi:MAG: synthase subunit gamma [Spirosoma sp.]|nr:synthase subunit gamma [Spirosoma sp.]